MKGSILSVGKALFDPPPPKKKNQMGQTCKENQTCFDLAISCRLSLLFESFLVLKCSCPCGSLDCGHMNCNVNPPLSATWRHSGRRNGKWQSLNFREARLQSASDANDRVACQPAPKYHTKGCSRSPVDSPGARTLVFAVFEPFSSCEFRASIARTPFCAILWRSPSLRGI